MPQKSHLPVMGVGPIYVLSIILITIFVIIFGGSFIDSLAITSIHTPNSTNVLTSTSPPVITPPTFTVASLFTLSENTPLMLIIKLFGTLIIFLGLIIYILAIRIKITKAVKENKLITTGVYSVVRNPFYSAWLFFCTGILLLTGNLYFALPLFLFFWLYLTILMKHTEEKWLTKLYGDSYREYCKKSQSLPSLVPEKSIILIISHIFS